jgi:hypothetical protein
MPNTAATKNVIKKRVISAAIRFLLIRKIPATTAKILKLDV